MVLEDDMWIPWWLYHYGALTRQVGSCPPDSSRWLRHLISQSCHVMRSYSNTTVVFNFVFKCDSVTLGWHCFSILVSLQNCIVQYRKYKRCRVACSGLLPKRDYYYYRARVAFWQLLSSRTTSQGAVACCLPTYRYDRIMIILSLSLGCALPPPHT